MAASFFTACLRSNFIGTGYSFSAFLFNFSFLGQKIQIYEIKKRSGTEITFI